MGRFKIKDGIVTNQDGVMVLVTADISPEEEKIIEAAGELLDVAKEYVSTGSKPKAILDKFKQILEKYEIE